MTELYIFDSLTKSICSKIVQDTFEKARDEYVSKADTWKAVPDSAYDEETKQPAIIYGVYHLLRLLGTDFIHNNVIWYLICILGSLVSTLKNIISLILTIHQ